MLLLLLLALVVPPSHAFGLNGHKVIAQLASNLLSREASQALVPYFKDLSLAEVVGIPDEYNHNPPGAWTYGYHFVDYVLGDTEYQVSNCPEPRGCCVSALVNYTRRQMAVETPALCRAAFNQSDVALEPCALVFLAHFVGDIHQPLHCAYKKDRGGNFVKVRFFGTTANLHKVWDSLLIYRYLDVHNSTWQQWATDLTTRVLTDPSQRKLWASVVDPIVWANESFNVTRFDVYNFGGDDLGQPYYDANMPIVTQRLMQAGVRLAALLEYVLLTRTPPKGSE